MKQRTIVPEPFAIGMVAVGVLLLVVPELRVAGAISVFLGVVYWLLMALLRTKRS